MCHLLLIFCYYILTATTYLLRQLNLPSIQPATPTSFRSLTSGHIRHFRSSLPAPRSDFQDYHVSNGLSNPSLPFFSHSLRPYYPHKSSPIQQAQELTLSYSTPTYKFPSLSFYLRSERRLTISGDIFNYSRISRIPFCSIR